MKKTSNADHGSVAEQREEMALRHLEHEPRRRRRREDGRRHLLLLPPQDDVRRCIHQSAQGRKKNTEAIISDMRPWTKTSGAASEARDHRGNDATACVYKSWMDGCPT
jgi:hypothetical protein